MHVYHARDVNDAYHYAMSSFKKSGTLFRTSPRGGSVLEYPEPWSTVYLQPWKMVLFDPLRDANPFFHFMEALWVLAGRKDVEFLTQYNKRMGTFSDDGVEFHAAYGARLRFDNGVDQFQAVIDLVREEPDTRRAVLQIWDCVKDLNVTSKDIPCNDLIFLRVNHNVLHITVCCRSNDLIWGCYGSNVVQFSMLQQYLAARMGLGIGTYTQISNNLHVYTDNPVWKSYVSPTPYTHSAYDLEIQGYSPMFDSPGNIDQDLDRFFRGGMNGFANSVFEEIAIPMKIAYGHYRARDLHSAHAIASQIKGADWRKASMDWLWRRIEKREAV